MAASNTNDMTKGKPSRLLIGFAFPLLLGSLCQQLYTVADSAVVGRLLGVTAFAALGAAGFLWWLAFSTILGFTQGFGVAFAQHFGGNDLPGLRRSIGASVWLTLALGLLVAVGGQFIILPVLSLTGTPAELVPQACAYLRWMFFGGVFTAFYNLSASLLRSLGNSKAPFVAVVISSFCNIALDLLFAGVFHWGVPGVAAATVISQLLALLYCLLRLKSIKEARIAKKDLFPPKHAWKELLALGTPLGFRDAVIAMGGLFVQAAINSYGSLFVAGVTAAKKYFGFLELAGGALDGALATFSAQNYGAGDLPRVKKGVRCAIAIGMSAAVAVSVLTLIFGRQLVSLLVTGTPEEMAVIMDTGYQALAVISGFLPVLYLLYLYRSALQGMGNSLIPMFSGFLELALRLASVWILPGFIGYWGVHLADPLGWLAAFLLLCVGYYKIYNQRVRALSQKP